MNHSTHLRILLLARGHLYQLQALLFLCGPHFAYPSRFRVYSGFCLLSFLQKQIFEIWRLKEHHVVLLNSTKTSIWAYCRKNLNHSKINFQLDKCFTVDLSCEIGCNQKVHHVFNIEQNFIGDVFYLFQILHHHPCFCLRSQVIIFKRVRTVQAAFHTHGFNQSNYHLGDPYRLMLLH